MTRALLSLVVLGAAAASTPARADEPATPEQQECVDAYVRGQFARKATHLVEAHRSFVRCAHVACPLAVAKDCRTWRDEVDTALPTVVFDVRDGRGAQATDVRVRVDGAPLVEALDGRAVPVDPGRHVFTLDLRGESPISREVTILEGSKAQRIEAAAPLRVASGQGNAEPDSGRDRVARPVPPLVWILGAVGLVGVSAFTVLGLSANAREDELRRSCAPVCSPSDREGVRALQIAADLSLIAGLVALGTATYLFVTRPERVVSPPRASGRVAGWSF